MEISQPEHANPIDLKMARSSASKQSAKAKGKAPDAEPEDGVEEDNDVKETEKSGSYGAEEDSNKNYGEKDDHHGDEEGTAGPPTPGSQPPPHQVAVPPFFAPYPYPPYAGMPPGYPPMMPPSSTGDYSSTYTDASTMSDPMPDTRRNRGGVTEPFPERLHRMLDATEREGLADVVSFFSHGRAFAIHKPRRFVAEIMPRFFRQSKLTSFQRQLNLYGFRRISQGPDNGGYYHELFLKGRLGLCVNMKRTKVKGAAKFKRDPDTEPNFYVMRPVSGPPGMPTGTSPGAPNSQIAPGPHPYPYPPPPYGYPTSSPQPYTAAQGAMGSPTMPYPYPPPPYWPYWGAPPPGQPQAAPTPQKSEGGREAAPSGDGEGNEADKPEEEEAV